MRINTLIGPLVRKNEINFKERRNHATSALSAYAGTSRRSTGVVLCGVLTHTLPSTAFLTVSAINAASFTEMTYKRNPLSQLRIDT